MRLRRALGLTAATTAWLAGGLHAQASDALYARFNALSGWEARGFTFDSGIGVKSVSQWNVPFVTIAPLGRKMSVDLTTYYVSGRVVTDADTQTLSGMTDTQLRLLYTMSRDRLVGSVSFNLPTGVHAASTSQFEVAGAVGSSYLSFPVSNSGTAFGATGGLAYAQRAGAWNLGVSGSVRYLGSYAPFSDEAVSYRPGMEARVRAGVDRVLGERSRLLLGATVSTFSTDMYSGSSGPISGSYAPGTRFIGELAFVRVIGRSTVTLAAWDFYRLAGDTNGVSNPDTKENVLNGELRLAYPIAPRLRVEPLIAFRQWNPSDSKGGYLGGQLKSGGVRVQAGLTDRWSAAVAGRYDAGWISDRANRVSLQGYGVSLSLRFEQ
jgi:hypothetical protein